MHPQGRNNVEKRTLAFHAGFAIVATLSAMTPGAMDSQEGTTPLLQPGRDRDFSSKPRCLLAG